LTSVRLCDAFLLTDLCYVVLPGDTASCTSLPGVDDECLVADGTSSRWVAEQHHCTFTVVSTSMN